MGLVEIGEQLAWIEEEFVNKGFVKTWEGFVEIWRVLLEILEVFAHVEGELAETEVLACVKLEPVLLESFSPMSSS